MTMFLAADAVPVREPADTTKATRVDSTLTDVPELPNGHIADGPFLTALG